MIREPNVSYDAKRGKYVFQYTDRNGDRHKKRFDTKEEAYAFRSTILYENYHNLAKVGSAPLLGDWIINYIRTYKANRVQKTSLRRLLQTARLVTPLANFRIDEITAPMIQQLYNELSEHSAAGNVRKVHILLNAAYKKAVQLDIIRHNPVDAAEPPSEKRRPIIIFTDRELKEIFRFLSDYHDKRYFFYFRLLNLTGMRPSEALALTWEDVKQDKMTIYIHSNLKNLPGNVIGETKTAAGVREVPVPTDFLQSLLDLKNPQSAFIFSTKTGKPVALHNIDRFWRTQVKRYTHTDKTIYTFRHTFATRLLAAGIPINEVARIMGHSTPSHTVNLYGHAIENYNSVIIEKIKQIF